LGLAITCHEEQKRWHKNVISAPVNENHIMVGAQFPAKLSRGNHAAAAAAQDYDLFSPIKSTHSMKAYFEVLPPWRCWYRIERPFKFRNRCSRHKSCSIRPAPVSSLPKDEVLWRNQMTSLSERSLIHSIVTPTKPHGNIERDDSPSEPG
jgi:hypothetical protein